MSGRDERKINKYPPECPNCIIKCHEWFLGESTWIIPEKQISLRNLRYPVICFGITPITRITEIVCQGCGRRFYEGDETFYAVVKAYKNNYGDPYHKDLDLNGRIADEWKRDCIHYTGVFSYGIRDAKMTENPDEVTCPLCLAIMAGQEEK